jgi:hypothetical protein
MSLKSILIRFSRLFLHDLFRVHKSNPATIRRVIRPE